MGNEISKTNHNRHNHHRQHLHNQQQRHRHYSYNHGIIDYMNPKGKQPLSQQEERRRSLSSSSTSSKTSSSTRDKRAALFSSSEVMEPTSLHEHYHQGYQYQGQNYQEQFQGKRSIRQEDFLNMHISKKDGKNNNKNIISKLFKHKAGVKKTANKQQSSENDFHQSGGVIDITNVAKASVGFSQAQDYKDSNYQYENFEDDSYYNEYENSPQREDGDDGSSSTILQSDRLHHHFKLHDNGRLPTILDVSYQSSTQGQDASMMNMTTMTGLLGETTLDGDESNVKSYNDDSNVMKDDDSDKVDRELLFENLFENEDVEESEEEVENDDIEGGDEEESEENEHEQDSTYTEANIDNSQQPTPGYSIVTEEFATEEEQSSAHDDDHNGCQTDEKGNAEDLDVNQSNNTVKSNSFLDKEQSSYEEDEEQINEITMPMARLTDLFGNITMNNSRYHHLTSPQEENEDASNKVSSVSSQNESDSSFVDDNIDSKMTNWDMLNETSLQDEEERESPYEMLKECHSHPIGESFFEVTNNEEENIGILNKSEEGKETLMDINETTIGVEASTINLSDNQENSNFSTSDENEAESSPLSVNEYLSETVLSKPQISQIERNENKRSPVPPSMLASKAPTEPRKANLLPSLNEECDKSNVFDDNENVEIPKNDYNINISRDLNVTGNDAVNITEHAVNVSNVMRGMISHPEKMKQSQIGTIITISRPSLEQPSPLPDPPTNQIQKKSYCDVSFSDNSTVTPGSKDAFTREAMLNAKFLFRSGDYMRIHKNTKPESKIDKQRLSLMHIKDARDSLNGIDLNKTNPLQLIESAKLELDEAKRRVSEGHKLDYHSQTKALNNSAAIHVESESRLTFKDSVSIIKPRPMLCNDHQSPETLLKNEAKMKEESMDNSEDINNSPPKSFKPKVISNNTNISSPAETRDSMADILDGISPSELQKRYSAITPMKTFSPYVRFKKAIRLFDKGGATTQSQVQENVLEMRKSPPVKNASPDKNEFVFHRNSIDPIEEIQSQSSETATMAPHTLALVKTLINKRNGSHVDYSLSEASNEISIEQFNEINNSLSEDEEVLDGDKIFDLHEMIMKKYPDSNSVVDEPSSESVSLSYTSNDVVENNCDIGSPYDENDELSIEPPTPTHSMRSPQSAVSESISASPYSTVSEEDIFTALIRKANAASPDASSVALTSTYSNYDDEPSEENFVVLKSAMKKKKVSENGSINNSPHNLHTVRWSLAKSNEKSVSPLQSRTFKPAVNPREGNTQRLINQYNTSPTESISEDNHNVMFSPLDELSPPPVMTKALRSVVNPREMFQRSAENDPASFRSNSFRAAVNPKEIYDNNTNYENGDTYQIDNSEYDKENTSVVSNSIYSPTGDTICTYSPLQMSKRNMTGNSVTNKQHAKPHSPSALYLSPKQQKTPMQARKWRKDETESAKKPNRRRSSDSAKKSSGKKHRRKSSGKMRVPLAKIMRN